MKLIHKNSSKELARISFMDVRTDEQDYVKHKM